MIYRGYPCSMNGLIQLELIPCEKCGQKLKIGDEIYLEETATTKTKLYHKRCIDNGN